MKKQIAIVGFCWVVGAWLLTGCDPSPKPLKEGVVWGVRWDKPLTESSRVSGGLYRKDKVNSASSGQYGEDMYGLLYPSHLEIRFVGSPDSHAQIIPLDQITWLEFGDGGVSIKHD